MLTVVITRLLLLGMQWCKGDVSRYYVCGRVGWCRAWCPPQRKMECIMLGITLRDHKRNTWIRHQTGVNAIIDVIKTGIHGWAGHIARFKDNRWTKRATEWTPREWTRRRGRPKTRWRDSLIRHLGPAWPRIAGVCGDSSGRGSSLRSERNPGGKW